MTLDLRQALLSTYPNPVIKPREGKAVLLSSLYGIHLPPPTTPLTSHPRRSLLSTLTSLPRSLVGWMDSHIGWLALASLLALAITAVALSRGL